MTKRGVCFLLALLLLGTAAAAEEGYRVTVTDEDGAPVAGVMVQFCSDTACMTAVTDENGAAFFAQGAGAYTVHILKAPEGFAPDDTEYPAPAEPGEVGITLRSEAADDAVFEIPAAGFHFTEPESYRKMRGVCAFDHGRLSTGILWVSASYFAVEAEQWDTYCAFWTQTAEAYQEGGELPEPPVPGWMSGNEYGDLFAVFALNGARGEEELRAALGETQPDWLEKLGSAGETVFFLGQFGVPEEQESAYRETMGELYAEFAALRADKESFAGALTLSEPVWPKSLEVGSVIGFETTDLDGSAVSSAALFAQAKVTMINVWATWCPPCRGELPELGRLAEEFAAQGGQLIGICDDGEEESETARALLAQAGAAYRNLVAPDNLGDFFMTGSLPTSYFVDSEGRLLLEPMIGAHVDAYARLFAEALEAAGY